MAPGEKENRDMTTAVTHPFVPGVAAMVDGYHYGEVWSHSPLTTKERMVSILTALMCRGHMSSSGVRLATRWTPG